MSLTQLLSTLKKILKTKKVENCQDYATIVKIKNKHPELKLEWKSKHYYGCVQSKVLNVL